MSEANNMTSPMEEKEIRDEEKHVEICSASWNTNNINNRYELMSPMLPQVNEELLYMHLNNTSIQNQNQPDQVHNPFVDSSPSYPPNPSIFTNNLDPSSQLGQYFPPQNPKFSSLSNAIPSNPLGDNGITNPQMGLLGLFGGFSNMNSNNISGLSFDLNLTTSATTMSLIPDTADMPGFGLSQIALSNSIGNKCNIIMRPLDSLPLSGEQPTLYQKRAAQRKNKKDNERGKDEVEEQGRNDKKRKILIMDGERVEGGNGLNNDDVGDSNHDMPNDGKKMLEFEGGGNKNPENLTDIVLTGATNVDKKGEMSGMSEHCQRNKLKDKLYMLRSVLPTITKMDETSILGDAIDYIKGLEQKVNDLNNELQSMPSVPHATSLVPMSATTLPSRVNEPPTTQLPSPNAQPPKVEVGLSEGGAVNIHMECDTKPGLLLSTLRTLDSLGLDAQQGVLSFFDGFIFDVFHAEQCNEGQNLRAEQIKAALMKVASSSDPDMI